MATLSSLHTLQGHDLVLEKVLGHLSRKDQGRLATVDTTCKDWYETLGTSPFSPPENEHSYAFMQVPLTMVGIVIFMIPDVANDDVEIHLTFDDFHWRSHCKAFASDEGYHGLWIALADHLEGQATFESPCITLIHCNVTVRDNQPWICDTLYWDNCFGKDPLCQLAIEFNHHVFGVVDFYLDEETSVCPLRFYPIPYVVLIPQLWVVRTLLDKCLDFSLCWYVAAPTMEVQLLDTGHPTPPVTCIVRPGVDIVLMPSRTFYITHCLMTLASHLRDVHVPYEEVRVVARVTWDDVPRGHEVQPTDMLVAAELMYHAEFMAQQEPHFKEYRVCFRIAVEGCSEVHEHTVEVEH